MVIEVGKTGLDSRLDEEKTKDCYDVKLKLDADDEVAVTGNTSPGKKSCSWLFKLLTFVAVVVLVSGTVLTVHWFSVSREDPPTFVDDMIPISNALWKELNEMVIDCVRTPLGAGSDTATDGVEGITRAYGDYPDPDGESMTREPPKIYQLIIEDHDMYDGDVTYDSAKHDDIIGDMITDFGSADVEMGEDDAGVHNINVGVAGDIEIDDGDDDDDDDRITGLRNGGYPTHKRYLDWSCIAKKFPRLKYVISQLEEVGTTPDYRPYN